ncbi:glycosyltransferase [Methylacidiphilales bacterium]|nr:glycosyltransferase [Candidatus Methylacidiphilales bacterium]
MRILHILSTPRAEGTPNLVLDWLSTGSHEQEVFVLNAQPADLTDQLRSGAKWYDESNHFSMGPRKFFAIAASIHRVCVNRKPDLVICWPTGFANWVCLGARWAGVKRLLVHCGNPTNRDFKHDWITRYVMWPLQLLGARCICCSNYVKNSFLSVPFVPGHLFYTVYNCSRGQAVRARAVAARQGRSPENKPSGIMVATLERHKDHRTLLKAINLVHQMEPTFKIRLVGDGSLRRELETCAAELHLEGVVEFLGTRRDVPELLGTSDLFIFSTTPQEGLGSVLLEALAAGLPVVASDVPACRELLAAGRYGMLVSPGDPAALAKAIVQALRHPTPTTPEEAMAYANSFTAQRMMREYLDLAPAE